MAVSGNVSQVLDSIRGELSKIELQQESNRAKKTQEIGKHLLLMGNNEVFARFSQTLLTTLQSCFKSSTKVKTWAAYHTATQNIGTLWDSLCCTVDHLENDPLLIQSVARSIFDKLLMERFGCDRQY